MRSVSTEMQKNALWAVDSLLEQAEEEGNGSSRAGAGRNLLTLNKEQVIAGNDCI